MHVVNMRRTAVRLASVQPDLGVVVGSFRLALAAWYACLRGHFLAGPETKASRAVHCVFGAMGKDIARGVGRG